jgi:hypothetical protein
MVLMFFVDWVLGWLGQSPRLLSLPVGGTQAGCGAIQGLSAMHRLVPCSLPHCVRALTECGGVNELHAMPSTAQAPCCRRGQWTVGRVCALRAGIRLQPPGCCKALLAAWRGDDGRCWEERSRGLWLPCTGKVVDACTALILL